MSSLVLARKYRSRNFDELVGQEHVVKALANALTQGRLHHAYLFTGTRGVGKTSVSRILAKSLNCVGPDGQGGITAHPCGVCHPCRDIDAGRFVDYVELDAASNRGVEEITALLDQSVYKPVTGRFKVYLIDEVHMLSAFAFNAMLKTLEEPPDYLKFILATTDPQKVPPTVLSRCLQFNLRPMAPQTVQQHLARVLADERVEAEPGALRLLSRAARGSMRDALSLADQAIAHGAGGLTEVDVRDMLGAVDRGHAVRIVESLANSDGAGLVAAADALRGLGLSAAGTLDELAALLQQMAVTQAVPEALDEADPETPTVRRLSPMLAADELQLAYSMALHGRAEIGLAPDEYSGLVMVLLRMLAFRPDGIRPSTTGSRLTDERLADSERAGSELAHEGLADKGSVDTRLADRATTDEVMSDATLAGATTADLGSTATVPSFGAAPASIQPGMDGATDPARGGFMPAVASSSTPAAEDTLEASPVSIPEDAPESALAPASSRSPSPSTSITSLPAAPRQAALRSSTASVATAVRLTLPAVQQSTSGSSGSRASIAASPTNGDQRVVSIEPDTSDAVDFGEPPPWLDVPFDLHDDEDTALPRALTIDASRQVASAPDSSAMSLPPAPPPAASAQPVAAPFLATALGNRWADLVDAMTRAGAISALTRELALQSECLQAVEPGMTGTWRLRVERESLRAPGLIEKLRAAMSGMSGGDVTLEVERGPAVDSPALRNAAERDRRQREAETLIHDDPLVKSLMAQFKTARIVPGSIKPV